MKKPSLINPDYKHSLSTVKIRQRPLVPLVLIGTLVLLAMVLYFKNTLSNAQSDKTVLQVVPIELPSNTQDSAEHTFKTPQQTVKKTTSPAPQELNWKQHTIKSGDNLASIFKRFNLSATTLHNIIQSDDNTKLLRKIKPGQTLRFAQNSDNTCVALDYDINNIQTLQVRATANGFKSTINEKPVETSHSLASAVIQNSLFYDAKQAGLSDKTIMELANIFGWDIDFSQGLRPGDSFSLLYESKQIEGERIENGHILAAEFTNQGDKYQAVRFVDKDGHAEYFSADGKSMRKTFLRNPIDFARVSSHFNLRRKHPVLNRIRAHKGVDYAASSGTPIKATGDGRITFKGVKGGYGRVVIIQHGQQYSSLYAHMSKYGRYKNGSYVKQGQTIGYVGKSGLATGPHLHYEFRVNGVHRNPLTTKFPAASPIKKHLLAEFKQQTTPLLGQLARAKQTQLALNQP